MIKNNDKKEKFMHIVREREAKPIKRSKLNFGVQSNSTCHSSAWLPRVSPDEERNDLLKADLIFQVGPTRRSLVCKVTFVFPIFF